MSSSTPSTTTTATIATSLAALTLGAYFYQRRCNHTSTSTCTSESTQTRHLSTLVETKSNTIDHLLDSSNDANVKKQEVHVGEVYHPHPHIVNDAYIASFTRYQQLYQYSIEHNDEFWSQVAKKQLDWFTPFTQTKNGCFIGGNPSWYLNGQLNACYNAVDRHVKTQGDKIAILWEGDDSKDVRRVTYSQLLDDVSQFANVLKRQGVRKGDAVCIYMPNIPEGIVAMLACARIGAVHSVVFAGFSADALRDRIQDAKCTVLITADEFYRAGKQVPLKAIADKALEECPDCKSVIVYKRTNTDKIQMKSGRDIWWHEAVAAERPYCPCEWMDAEDTLFYLYTSGSTGKPKGILHTTAGYLVYASFTHKYAFDVRRDDIYACMADIGWVTGHSYIVYGPLCNGNTTFQFEGMPAFPNSGRYWDMVERHKINVFYTAPTALRAIMRDGNSPVQKYDRSSLRVLGSVGEPINPEAWRWYNDIVGNGKCAIVDTYWQTETGGFLICPIPGAIATKPGSATLPFFGVEPAVLDPATGQEIKETEASGVLAIKRPWPGMARTIFGDHDRFRTTYLTMYPGYYFTGDGCMRDKDGYYWITGRVDDVVNVSGHRIGSAEIESVLVGHPNVAESAVIGVPHEIKGQALFAYVTLKNGVPATPELVAALKMQVRQHVGAFAVPDHILLTPALPKTRSGKIMRRLLRKIATQDTSNLGDISTLADETVVQTLIDAVNNMYKKK